VDKFAKIYHYFNLLSLDVVLGALAGMYFFAHLLGVKLNQEVYLLLALTVWIIYTLDHLMDAKKAKGGPSSLRHAFHLKHKRGIQSFLILAFVFVVILLFWKKELHILIKPGLILAFSLALVLGLVIMLKKRLAFLKEFLIAIFYVLGIALAPFVYVDKLIPVETYYMAGFYFLIAYINLLVLSQMDRAIDQKDGYGSVSMWINEKMLSRMILLLIGVAVLYGLMLLVFLRSYFHIYTGILLMILFIHLESFLKSSSNELSKRRVMELSFVLPFLLVLFL
jgi:4-hydroxybenzoate polyprenyltransferase